MKMWTIDDNVAECAEAMGMRVVKSENTPCGQKYYIGGNARDEAIIKACLLTLIEYSIQEEYHIEESFFDLYIDFVTKCVFENPNETICSFLEWCNTDFTVKELADSLTIDIEY